MGLVSDAANVLVKKAGDAMPGPLAMSANKITAVADPTDPQDTATKNYVDIRGYATVGYTDSRDSKRVHKEGDTMTGPLALSANRITTVADPTDLQDAATKNYVDAQGSGGPSVAVLCRVGSGTADHRSINLGSSPHMPISPLFGNAFGDDATWHPVAGLFTASQDGMYAVFLWLRVAASTSAVGPTLGNVYTSKNGSVIYASDPDSVYLAYKTPVSPTTHHPFHLSGVVSLMAGETLGLNCSHGRGVWLFHTASMLQILFL